MRISANDSDKRKLQTAWEGFCIEINNDICNEYLAPVYSKLEELESCSTENKNYLIHKFVYNKWIYPASFRNIILDSFKDYSDIIYLNSYIKMGNDVLKSAILDTIKVSKETCGSILKDDNLYFNNTGWSPNDKRIQPSSLNDEVTQFNKFCDSRWELTKNRIRDDCSLQRLNFKRLTENDDNMNCLFQIYGEELFPITIKVIEDFLSKDNNDFTQLDAPESTLGDSARFRGNAAVAEMLSGYDFTA